VALRLERVGQQLAERADPVPRQIEMRRHEVLQERQARRATGEHDQMRRSVPGRQARAQLL
jgi:hypothetical protein